MFGFRSGDAEGAVDRKKQYGRDAQNTWKFLTNSDLSSIKNAVQLIAMIKVRSCIPERQATRDVQAWMHGKQF